MQRISGVIALVFVGLTAVAPNSALAQAPVRNFFVGGGLGLSAGLDGGPALFKLQEEAGYQLDPISLGEQLDLQLRFGGDLAQQFGDFFILQFGARVTASFGVWRNEEIGIRVAPSVMLGGAVLLYEEVCVNYGIGGRVCAGGGAYGAFNLQFATQAELELLEGLLTIWFRPVAIDGFFRDGSHARWDILAGVDVHL